MRSLSARSTRSTRKPVPAVPRPRLEADRGKAPVSRCLRLPAAGLRVLVALTLTFLPSLPVLGVHLGMESYTAEDGLAGDSVLTIYQDRIGYLWIGTTTGLSRFDGSLYQNFNVADGLPHPRVDALNCDRGGTYWIGTPGGLARLSPGDPPAGKPIVRVPMPVDTDSQPGVEAILIDPTDRIWVATDHGLFEAPPTTARRRFERVRLPSGDRTSARRNVVTSLARDEDGNLWIGTNHGLVRRSPDGTLTRIPVRPRDGLDPVHSLLADASGRLWITHWGLANAPQVHWGLYVVRLPLDASSVQWGVAHEAASRAIQLGSGLRGGSEHSRSAPAAYTTGTGPMGPARLHRVLRAEDGTYWFATADGALRQDASGLHRITFGNALANRVNTVFEDRGGHVWFGTDAGLFRIVQQGVTTFTTDDGLAGDDVRTLFLDPDGRLVAVTSAPVGYALNRFNGRSFTAFLPYDLRRSQYVGWGWGQWTFRDERGEWWLASGQGVLHYPSTDTLADLEHEHPDFRLTHADGLGSDDVFRMFEDRAHNVWIGTFGDPGLSRWHRATRHLIPVQAVGRRTPTAFAEDSADDIWVGFYDGEIARWKAGHLEWMRHLAGSTPGLIRALLVDGDGTLWIGTSARGLFRIDHPASSHPVARRYATSDGLDSDTVLALATDRWGRLFCATGRGIDELEPHTGRWAHFTRADGLAGGDTGVELRDRDGNLWLGSTGGLSRLTPRLPVATPPPPVRIQRLRLGGEPVPLPETGVTDLRLPPLSPQRNSLQVEFASIVPSAGDSLLYTFRLQGAHTNWAPPSRRHRLDFAHLGPGHYTLQLRSISAANLASQAISTLRFTVLPPLWRRGPFLGLLLALLATSLALAVWIRHRRREQVQMLRNRIAIDLHDDLGARLARIHILSEVAQREIKQDPPHVAGLLKEMGNAARSLVAASGDVAWAVDPQSDNLRSLAARVRRFCEQLLGPAGIRWRVTCPAEDCALDTEVRRRLLLVCQEALHNVARHAQASQVMVRFSLSPRQLLAEIDDDGRGFKARDASDTSAISGQGLRNLRIHSERLRGTLEIRSQPGDGTTIRLRIPRPPRHWWQTRRRREA